MLCRQGFTIMRRAGAHDHIFPVVVCRPLQPQVDNAAGLSDVLKASADRFQHACLLGKVVSATSGLAKRIIQIDSPRRADRFGNRAGAAEADSCDACRLQGARDQSHGLMANGSDRNQQRKIHFFFLHFGNNGWCQHIANLTAGINAAHKGQSVARQCANASAGDEVV